MSVQDSRSTRYEYIDVLRGFAALWVVAYHLWNRFYPHLSTQHQAFTGTAIPDPAAFFAFGYGYSGVTLFFVLSGLCIHFPQARRKLYRIDVRRFAIRRFWRLYPAYIASIVFAALVLAIPKLILAARGQSFDWWATLQIHDALVNALFLQPFWPDSLEFNGVYWTLVYEVQFYIAYPILLLCLRNTGLLPVGLALLAAELIFSFVPSPYSCFFLSRYFEWFLGVVAAELIVLAPDTYPHRTGAVCALVGLACGLYSTFLPVAFPLRDFFIAIGFFGVILILAKGSGIASRIGRIRSLAIIGTFSYSLYLVHVPIIDLVWTGLERVVIPRSGHAALVIRASLIAVPIALFVAYAFYRLFELPFISREKQQRGAPIPAVAP
jgi:peptidoglycan/LPS O-acetylase OafA/YrhL